jgi:hypothetical protein
MWELTALDPEVFQAQPAPRANVRESHIWPKEGQIWGTHGSGKHAF